MAEPSYQEVVEVLKSKVTEFKANFKVNVVLSEETDVLSLGLDSLDIMDYLLFIEEKFDIRIPDELMENLGSLIIGEMANYILKSREANN